MTQLLQPEKSPILPRRPDEVSNSRLIEIDTLRGLAALWVVMFHFSASVSYFLRDDPVVAAQITPFRGNLEGLLAVDLFFMISGFVIFMTLERCHSVLDFAVSRFSRLYPVYWACLSLSTLTIILLPLPVQSITAPQALAGITMFNAFIGFNPVEAVYWSLAVELAFYVIMTCVFWATWMDRIEVLGGIWLAVSAVVVTAFPSLFHMLPWRIQTASILQYTPLFLAGILLYRGRTRGWTRVRVALLAACFAVRLTSFGAAPEMIIGTILIFAVFVPASLGWAPFLRWRPLAFLGGISYPLYLVHQSIGYRIQYWAVMVLGVKALLGFLIALVAVLILAWAVSVLIERPARRWIRGVYRTNRGERAGIRPASTDADVMPHGLAGGKPSARNRRRHVRP